MNSADAASRPEAEGASGRREEESLAGETGEEIRKSVDAALDDYRSMHRKQYEDRLRREAEEEEKAKRLAEERKGYEMAAKLQQEEESLLATRVAADAEMSRQLFAQLNRHVQPDSLSRAAVQSAACDSTSADASAAAYSAEWYEHLRQQQEHERRVLEGYSAFPGQSDEENVRPPMRTNYTERLIDDGPVGWTSSTGGFSESLLGPPASQGRGGWSWMEDAMRETLGLPERPGVGEQLSPEERAHQRRRAVYVALVCFCMVGPLVIALIMLISQMLQ
uniref:Putative transmembrane protein n=1 Tax=Toxoplasma gondii COUG TaxID=1074873 RepID=A0A2G8YEV6_TOXGO|nr:putative transmembrane protein [Toxoplasma gondii COUG]